MKRDFWFKKFPATMLICGLVIIAAAWQGGPSKITHTGTDTVPERNKKVKDIDAALEDLEMSKTEIERSLKEINIEKMNAEIRESLKNVHMDSEKMKEQMEKLMKEIDLEKMHTDVQKALKDVDMEKMKIELDRAMKSMKEVDMAKIKAEIDASMAKVDWNKIKVEMDKLKEINFEKIESDLKKIKPDVENSIRDAHESIEKAKKELTEYKGFIDQLDKDGLINKKQSYTISYQKGELTINGKKQSGDAVKKYDFLKDRKDFTIKKDEDNFNINND
jgi:hypothetical protein